MPGRTRTPATPAQLEIANRRYPEIRAELVSGASRSAILGKFKVSAEALDDAMRKAGDDPMSFASKSGGKTTSSSASTTPTTTTFARNPSGSAASPQGQGGIPSPSAPPSNGQQQPSPTSSPPTTPTPPPQEQRPVPGTAHEPYTYPGVSQNEGFGPSTGFSPATGQTPLMSPMQAISFGGGEVSPPPMAPPGSPLMNQYEVPDLYLTLYSICVENGLRPTFANGVVRQFRHFLPDDYRGLDSILTTGGTNVQARNSIVNAWKLETKEGLSPNGSNASSETGDSPEEISKRIERIRKEAGDTGTPLSEVQDLEREAARLKLEEARIALA